jgi:hypothetical protein
MLFTKAETGPLVNISLLRVRTLHTFPDTFMGCMSLVNKSEKMEINNIFPKCVESFARGLWDRGGKGLQTYLKKW